MSSEVSHTQTNTVCFHLHAESKKQNKQTYKTETGSQKQKRLMVAMGGQGGADEGNEEIQTARCKVSHGEVCTAQGTRSITP